MICHRPQLKEMAHDAAVNDLWLSGASFLSHLSSQLESVAGLANWTSSGSYVTVVAGAASIRTVLQLRPSRELMTL